MHYHLPTAPTTYGKNSDDDHDGGGGGGSADDHVHDDDDDEDDKDDNGNDDGHDLVDDMPRTTGLTSCDGLRDEGDPTHYEN